jgi:hypothetical protein
MKFLLTLAAFIGLASTYDCPHDLEVKCIDDINKAYPACKKAEEDKGKDLPADLECIKYMATVEKECWPCICWVAQQEKWTIKGC